MIRPFHCTREGVALDRFADRTGLEVRPPCGNGWLANLRLSPMKSV